METCCLRSENSSHLSRLKITKYCIQCSPPTCVTSVHSSARSSQCRTGFITVTRKWLFTISRPTLLYNCPIMYPKKFIQQSGFWLAFNRYRLPLSSSYLILSLITSVVEKASLNDNQCVITYEFFAGHLCPFHRVVHVFQLYALRRKLTSENWASKYWELWGWFQE